MRLWDGMSTQWRAGAMGVLGLDYSVMETVSGLLNPPLRLTSRLFSKLRALEIRALKAMAERMERLREEQKRK